MVGTLERQNQTTVQDDHHVDKNDPHVQQLSNLSQAKAKQSALSHKYRRENPVGS